jgi:sulfur-carrier protein adenylyltransferase/sulfurtransferase
MPSIAQIAQQVRPHIKECQPETVAGEREASAPVRIVDVREQSEWDGGHIPGAELIPLGTLAEAAAERLPDKDEDIVVHCAAGVRSAVAAYQLQQLGYTKVRSMAGGFNLWRERGLPVQAPLRRDQLERYSRHLLIPEVGIAGQQKLLASKVLLVGAGGLGSPSSYYLAAAGVGTLGIVDSDVVDATNLQRQILHSSERIGEPKVDSAKRTLEALNPDVRVIPYRDRLTSANIDQVIADYDVIVDGADNFPTRYLLNDASIKWRKPVVHGSIYRFEGQVTVFKPFEGPCYRCLFHEPPPPELAPSCAEAGVLGVLPGVIGTIQANEVLKLLLGVGEPLVGRYLLFDALEASFREVKLRRDPKCPACGEHPTITEYIDYEGFCAAPAQWRAEHEGAAAPAD